MNCLQRCFKRKVDVSPSTVPTEGSTPIISVSELSITPEIQYADNVKMIVNPIAPDLNKL
jgi:hypothetical protein